METTAIIRNERITNRPLLVDGKPRLWPDVRRPKVEASWIYQPEVDWAYSHHPSITFFKGFFHAVWSCGRRDEDAAGQSAWISKSKDGRSWDTPKALMTPHLDASGQETVLTASGFHIHQGTLVAYVAEYEVETKKNTTLYALTTNDGLSWSAPRDLKLPVCPNHGPQATRSGRLVIAGNIAFPYTDDPSGLDGWKMAGIYGPGTVKDDPSEFWTVRKNLGWPTALCEGAFYQTDDNVLHMLLRSTGEAPLMRRFMWLTESRDDGATWGSPVETDYSNLDTKFHCGRLPDGRYYMVACPVEGPRSPLVLSLSRDGACFDAHFLLGETTYRKKIEGRHKGGEYGYPHTMVHAGSLYVIISRQKEAVEVLRVSLSDLSA